MEIQFRGHYDRETFFKAVKLANRKNKNQRQLIFIATIFALVAAGILLQRVLQSGDWASNLIWLLAALVLGGTVAWINLAPYFAAWKMWGNPGTRRELRGQVTNQGIVYDLKEGRNEILWGRFTRVRTGPDFVTLVRNDGLLIVFPQNFFRKSADWRKFFKFVERKYAQNKKN
jgi:hypothetical protein